MFPIMMGNMQDILGVFIIRKSNPSYRYLWMWIQGSTYSQLMVREGDMMTNPKLRPFLPPGMSFTRFEGFWVVLKSIWTRKCEEKSPPLPLFGVESGPSSTLHSEHLVLSVR